MIQLEERNFTSSTKCKIFFLLLCVDGWDLGGGGLLVAKQAMEFDYKLILFISEVATL
jgi:hypothetical protein